MNNNGYVGAWCDFKSKPRWSLIKMLRWCIHISNARRKLIFEISLVLFFRRHSKIVASYRIRRVQRWFLFYFNIQQWKKKRNEIDKNHQKGHSANLLYFHKHQSLTANRRLSDDEFEKNNWRIIRGVSTKSKTVFTPLPHVTETDSSRRFQLVNPKRVVVENPLQKCFILVPSIITYIVIIVI